MKHGNVPRSRLDFKPQLFLPFAPHNRYDTMYEEDESSMVAFLGSLNVRHFISFSELHLNLLYYFTLRL